FVFELIPWPAVAFAERIATLEHEAADDAVKDDAVVERLLVALAGSRVLPLPGAFSEADEVGHGLRRLRVEQLSGEVAEGGFEMGVSRHAPFWHGGAANRRRSPHLT